LAKLGPREHVWFGGWSLDRYTRLTTLIRPCVHTPLQYIRLGLGP
jgi:hypothetical protein